MTRRYPTDGHVGEIASGLTYMVRPATATDLPGITTVHQKAFRRFFLTRRGNRFLRRYYALVLDYRAGIVPVSERCGILEGFVCGFVEPPEFYRLMWCNKRTFALPALLAVVHHPSLATSMLHGVQRVQSSASRRPARSCELSSIAVAPEAGGDGLGRALCHGMGEFYGRAMRLSKHGRGRQRASECALSANRIPTHAALPAADGTLDERIRHRSPGGR